MAPQNGAEAASRPTGFFDLVRSLVSTVIGLLQTRLDLACTELEEERERLKEIVLLAAILFFCAALGVLLLTVLVVTIFWDSHRFYVLGGFAVFYLGVALIAARMIRRKALSRPKLFSATLAELAKDSERLRS